jgi:integration host factor subunit beta
MNRKDLVLKLKETHQLAQSQAAKAVDMFFGEMSSTLTKGDRVEIRGLCSM